MVSAGDISYGDVCLLYNGTRRHSVHNKIPLRSSTAMFHPAWKWTQLWIIFSNWVLISSSRCIFYSFGHRKQLTISWNLFVTIFIMRAFWKQQQQTNRKNREARPNATNMHLSPGLRQLKAAVSLQCKALSVPPHLHHLWFKSQPIFHFKSQCHIFLGPWLYMKQTQRCHKVILKKNSITLQILWVIRYLSMFVCGSWLQPSYPCDAGW